MQPDKQMNRAGCLGKLYRPVGWFIACITAVLLALLCFMALRHSAAFHHEEFQEQMTVVPADTVQILLTALVFGAVAVGIGWLSTKGKRGQTLLIAIASAGVVLLGCAWSLSVHGHPVDDQKKVWDIAVALANGTTDGMDLDYLIMFPYQSSMALFFEPLVRLFGPDPYPAFGIFNALCAGACVWALCSICALIWPEKGAAGICAVLCLAFVPLSIMSGFLYGTLAASAMGLWAMYGVLRLCRGGAAWWWLLTLMLPLAVVCYNGSLLFAAAAFCLLAADGLLGGGKKGLLYRLLPAVLLLVICMNASTWAGAIFTWRTGVQLGDGIPKTAWAVMGLTAENTNSGPGGYNSYTKLLFWENNADSAATSAAAMQDLREYLASWRDTPHENFGFLHEKIQTEWLDPWFDALTGSYHPEVDTPGRFASLLCGGSLLAPLEDFLRAVLALIYGMAGFGTLALAVRGKGEIWKQGMGVCFLGCFLFQVVWENHSRYCFPYFLCLIPVAAAGLAQLAPAVGGFARKKGLPCKQNSQETAAQNAMPEAV